MPERALNVAVGLSQNTTLDTVVRTASFTGWLLWPLGALAVGSFTAALIRSHDRRRTVLRIGVGLVASGLLWITVLIVGVAVVSRLVDGAEHRAALRAVFRSATHVLMLIARVVFSAGIVVTMAALLAGEEWIRPKLHGILGALIVSVGVLVAVYPEVMVAVVARSIGLFLAFIGLVAVLDVVGAQGWSGSGDGRQSQTLRRVAVIGTAVIASIAVLIAFGGFSLYRSLNATHSVAPDRSRHVRKPVAADEPLDLGEPGVAAEGRGGERARHPHAACRSLRGGAGSQAQHHRRRLLHVRGPVRRGRRVERREYPIELSVLRRRCGGVATALADRTR